MIERGEALMKRSRGRIERQVGARFVPLRTGQEVVAVTLARGVCVAELVSCRNSPSALRMPRLYRR